MVGVRKGVIDDLPGFLLSEQFLVDKYSQQFDNTESRMGIVELYAHLFCKVSPLEFTASFLCVAFVATNDILKGSADQQILLF